MKKNYGNIYFIFACIAFFISFGIGHFIALPDFVKGFCTGICLVLYPASIYAMSRGSSKLRDYKKRFINKLVKPV